MFQLSANPATAEAVERLDMETDIRAVLPAIHVPTLLLRRPEAPYTEPEVVAYVAAQISGATLVALAGRDASPYPGDTGPITDEIEAFLTGERHGPSPDRILSTVLFTDIVGSTQRLAELGDARWANLLAQHDDLARREIERHRGRYIVSTGDGLLATFDGPARAVRWPRRSARPSASSAWISALGATPVRLNSLATTFAASRCTSARGSARSHAQGRFW